MTTTTTTTTTTTMTTTNPLSLLLSNDLSSSSEDLWRHVDREGAADQRVEGVGGVDQGR